MVNAQREPVVAARGPQAPTRARYGTLAFLCALTFVLYLDRMCIGKAAPFIQRDLSLTDRQMGYVHAAFALSYAAFEVLVGHWGDKHGSRWVLLRIVAWWSLFTALTGMATGFASLVAMRFLFGAGEAGALPNVTRVIDRWFPPTARGRMSGFINMPALMGGMVAPIGTAYLIEGIGWRWVFAIYGSLGVVWVALFAWWFRDTPREHPWVNEAEAALIGPPPTTRPADHLPLVAIARSRNVLLLCGVLVAGGSAVQVLAAWYATYLEKVLGVSNVTSGWLNGLLMAGGAVGCLVGGWLADHAVAWFANPRWARSLVGCAAFSVAALAMACGAVARSPEWKSVWFAAVVFGVHLHLATWWRTNSQIGGRHTAAVFGFVNSAGGFGVAAVQILAGFLGRDHWNQLFACLSLVLALGAACWLFVDARVPIPSSDEPAEA
jgi:ACS family glucarate transporter-like MFS transporter